MRAVILVGGEGTRLRPLTLTTPKQMLAVAGRPMIERVLHHLAEHGVDDVVLALGYRPDAFLAAYPDGRFGNVRLDYAVESEPLDTAGAIAYAARCGGIAERFLVVNGDVLTDLDVASLIDFHHECGAEATIALTPVDDPSSYGVVPTDGDGLVTAFIEKPPAGTAPTNCINAGTYVLEPSVLDRIAEGRRVSIEREVFPALVAEGRLSAMESHAFWLDAGVPSTYLKANLHYARLEDTLDRPGPGSRIHASAVVVDSVIGGDVIVGPGARVENSVLADHVAVGDGALVHSSMIGRASRIGRNAVVDALSVLGDGAEVGAGTRVSGQRVVAAE